MKVSSSTCYLYNDKQTETIIKAINRDVKMMCGGKKIFWKVWPFTDQKKPKEKN